MFALGTDGVSGERSPAGRLKSWQNMSLTPGRIPSFFVPPKLCVSPRLGVRRAKRVDEYRLLSSSSPEEPPSEPQSPLASPRFPPKLRFTPRSNRKRRPGDSLDSSAQAAMSLQHVDKVVTPYGFCSLAFSPGASRRESLFHKRNRGAGTEVQSSAGSSPELPEHSGSPEPRTTPDKAESDPDGHGSVRKGLRLLMNKPKSVLKSLSPGWRKGGGS